MTIPADFPEFGPAIPYHGHRHFWQQATARRQFIRTSAGMTALMLGANLGLALPVEARESNTVAPTPIPGGILLGQFVGFPNDTTISHVFPPAFGQEVSTITDFNGVVAAADIQGKGIGTNTETGVSSTLFYDADMRFMQGRYIGVDGKKHHSTFGFI